MKQRKAQNEQVRFVLLGGFLGAGKTTALLRLARRYAAAGKRVGAITNDQADDLVDTATFRAAGWTTEEIPGGCFCCKFDALLAAAGRLQDGHHPDVLLGEPVGSCTDLVATVVRPLQKLYAHRFRVAPYAALLDPFQALRTLGGKGGSFSAKVAYIYQMQQNEADIVAINKVDALTPDELAEVSELVRRNFLKARVLPVSARTGEGFDRLAEMLDSGDTGGTRSIDVDYDVYAEGEALLGWLNTTGRLVGGTAFDVDQVALSLASEVGSALLDCSARPAHVKTLLRTPAAVAIANLVGDAPAELSRPARTSSTAADLLLNARAEASPEVLRQCVETALQQVADREGLKFSLSALQDLSPGRPVPTHRIAGG